MNYHKRNEKVQGFFVREHPLYSVWAGMKTRCYNPLAKAYVNYGARGITVCDAWLDFAPFANDMGLKPHPDLTLERIDNDPSHSRTVINRDNLEIGHRTSSASIACAFLLQVFGHL